VRAAIGSRVPSARTPSRSAPDGPAFTPDDVIEFHYLLEDDTYIREFLAERS
jgi:hypothetical protein